MDANGSEQRANHLSGRAADSCLQALPETEHAQSCPSLCVMQELERSLIGECDAANVINEEENKRADKASAKEVEKRLQKEAEKGAELKSQVMKCGTVTSEIP